MLFDVQTLYYINVALVLATATVAFLFWRRHRDQIGMAEWAIAMATGAAGLLILSVFGPAPDMALSVGANSLVVAGFVIAWESLRRFNGRPAANARVAGLALAFLVIFGVASYLDLDLRALVILRSLALAACAVLAGLEVLRGAKQDPLSGRWSTAVIMGAVVANMVLRVIVAALAPSDSPEVIFESPVQSHILFATTITLVGLSVGGLSMMANERLRLRYQTLAVTDELTRLFNRRFFFEQGGRLAQRAKMSGSPACVLMMDLDHFSRINTRFGHPGGDRVLSAFAAILTKHMRAADLASRYGGEEFCILFCDTEMTEAMQIAERLRAEVAATTIDIDGRPATITVSAGLAALREGDLEASIKRADEALYRAKSDGRNRVAACPEDSA